MTSVAKRRCRHCGGTLWRDSEVVKCIACSRPADGSAVPASVLGGTGPKLPGARRSIFRNLK